jgi:hypothetical protein
MTGRAAPQCRSTVGKIAHRASTSFNSRDPVLADEAFSAASHQHVVQKLIYIRNTSLDVPLDFDISPYFAIVKPRIEDGFD